MIRVILYFVLAATPDLFDPGYLSRPPTPQSEPPTAPLSAIAAPSSSAPALVSWGETFSVTVQLPPGVDPGRPEEWVVALTTRTKTSGGEWIGQPVDLRYVLSVEEVRVATTPGLSLLTVRLGARPPRDTYHLSVAGPGGLQGTRVYAVRVLGAAAERFRFVVIGDSQLRDPTTRFSGGDLNNGSYPRRGTNDAESMLIQQIQEMSFLDPDFVIHVGDLVYGLDYREEYPETLAVWWARPLPTFLVPGNHDALALYELALKEGWWKDALKSVRCAKYILEGDVTAVGVFQLLACLFGDLKKMLFEDLSQDGLDYFHRHLGASDYSFDLGKFHFVGINSHSGTAERRHAFVLSLGFLGIDFGASPVDNYGGTLTDDQLKWVQRDLEKAGRRGQTIVLFLHHDPRGNVGMPWGQRYHENQPFPTEPLGLRKFQEWNYEGEWDSDPKDRRGTETQTENSAVKLLRLMARHASYVFTGHIHDDIDTVVEPGQELAAGSGIRAKKRLYQMRVTAASSTPERDDGYWGFRLIESDGPHLVGLAFFPKWGWKSVPSGNLWISGTGLPGPTFSHELDSSLLFVVHNGLPKKLSGLLRAFLPGVPEGYRFPEDGGSIELVDVGIGDAGKNIYYLKVDVPAIRGGSVPVPEGEEERVQVRYERAQGNKTPVVEFALEDDEVYVGHPVKFDGGATKDPEGRPLLTSIWDFGDGHSARGLEATHAYKKTGRYPVSLTAIDNHGAYARYSTSISVVPAPSCSFGGTACAATSVTLILFGLIVVVLWLRRRGR
ncbi:PKD domain-containing protein [Myxococcota bacterium]